MDETSNAAFHITDEKGVRGTLDLTVVPPQGSESKLVLVRFDDGSQVFADAATFIEQGEGRFLFPGSFADLIEQNKSAKYGAAAFGETAHIVIPLLAEELKIARKKVLTGGVRVHKTVAERTETIDEPTLREDVQIERVPINKFVDAPPEIRHEGDTIIVPLLEEVLVIEKKLVLREEIRVITRRETVRQPQQFVLRSESATLEEIKPGAEGERINSLSAPIDKGGNGE